MTMTTPTPKLTIAVHFERAEIESLRSALRAEAAQFSELEHQAAFRGDTLAKHTARANAADRRALLAKLTHYAARVAAG